jgi:hypothetical protein
VTAVGAKKLDLLVAEFLPVTIKLAIALRAGHPKNFGHAVFPPDSAEKPVLMLRSFGSGQDRLGSA